MKHKPTRVEVEWLDIWASPRWDDTDPAEMEPITCRQVGYMVAKTRTKVVLVNTLCSDGGSGGATVIPRGCVVAIRKI